MRYYNKKAGTIFMSEIQELTTALRKYRLIGAREFPEFLGPIKWSPTKEIDEQGNRIFKFFVNISVSGTHKTPTLWLRFERGAEDIYVSTEFVAEENAWESIKTFVLKD